MCFACKCFVAHFKNGVKAIDFDILHRDIVLLVNQQRELYAHRRVAAAACTSSPAPPIDKLWTRPSKTSTRCFVCPAERGRASMALYLAPRNGGKQTRGASSHRRAFQV